MGIITAFGFTQFAEVLSDTHIKQNHQLIVSHLTPFGARMDIEIIETPSPLSGNRSKGDKYLDGDATKYVHIKLSQRTIAHPECQTRDDGEL